jgi:hypothetical protein
MKYLFIFLVIFSFCFSINTNWSKHEEWNKIIKKEEKKKKIGKVFLFILGGSVHVYIISSSIKYYRR